MGLRNMKLSSATGCEVMARAMVVSSLNERRQESNGPIQYRVLWNQQRITSSETWLATASYVPPFPVF